MSKKIGILLALGTAIISGLSIFFNKFAVAQFKDPYAFTTLKNIGVALLLCAVILLPTIWSKLKKLKKKDWFKLLVIAIIGGSIPFLLFFKGLSMNSAVSAAFIHKTLFIWVSIGAFVAWREKISKIQLSALVILLGTLLFFDLKNILKLDASALMILGATLLWALEFLMAKMFLQTIDPKILAWARMFFGGIVLMAFTVLTGHFQISEIAPMAWGWMALSVSLLFGYVVTWYHALQKLPASVAASILVVAYPITSILNYIFVTHQITFAQAVANCIVVVTVLIIAVNYYQQVKNNVIIQPLIHEN